MKILFPIGTYHVVNCPSSFEGEAIARVDAREQFVVGSLTLRPQFIRALNGSLGLASKNWMAHRDRTSNFAPSIHTPIIRILDEDNPLSGKDRRYPALT